MQFNPVSTPMKFDPSSSPRNVTDGDMSRSSVFFPGCSTPNNERSRFQSYWTELTKNFGILIDYWVHGYSFDTHDFFYGEDPTSKFSPPRRLRAAGDYTSANNILTRFGIMGEHDVELYISREDWEKSWGGVVVPKMKDLFRVVDSACDRPEGQPPLVFEVTDKYDRANDVDFLGGHYVWKLTAKRFMYSYEDGAPDEKGGKVDDPSDTDFFGRLNPEPKTKDKPYNSDVDEEASRDFQRPDARNNPYGNYL